MISIETRLRQQANSLDFALFGIAPATSADGFEHLEEWLRNGFASTMDYMQRHAGARRHPSSIMLGVRAVVMVGMNYNSCAAPEMPAEHGKVARYARGQDYHDVMRDRLKQLLAWLQSERPGCRGRAVVDTAPLLERDFARRAGLGWIGKNTMLINKRLGSYCYLGALLVDIELESDAPHTASHCGSCTRCLDACPTQAFPTPGVLDARRCISYLTIERREAIPVDLRAQLDGWIFGCDICQEVCPWNRKAPLGSVPELQPRPDLESLDLYDVLRMTEDEFQSRFRGTALLRTRRRGLLRNAALLLGTNGDPAALPALRAALGDPDEMVRDATRWAIERIDKKSADERDELAGLSRRG
jgi:epoxyqueuosine reductase